ncbi:hypothetical protein A2154_01665 [Candidatus Gottesmanbacteria bacterium RBG_16_43_7]|uniref:Transcriptional repressor n=1 Tax=Candidatus Gottesmanbacteria bacterium RBG_16_43_7 TaxID=1798373 RepID=A0A1F5ZBC7_9BACT|nr:MAG: hypothetical protein A2154_01665 [Candidatus Gottesmanbacteria bacterium RBG_16_43_7]
MHADSAIEKLQNRGHRITKIRQAVITVFAQSHYPISAGDILIQLTVGGFYANKSTVYRELTFLARVGLIREVRLTNTRVHYESSYIPHHHHLICNKCGSVREIFCRELELPLERVIEQAERKGFAVKDHSLEFFGFCIACR